MTKGVSQLVLLLSAFLQVGLVALSRQAAGLRPVRHSTRLTAGMG